MHNKRNQGEYANSYQEYSLKNFLGVFAFSRRALALVWQTSRPLTMLFAFLTLVAGGLPALAAWIGQMIVDSVVLALETPGPGDYSDIIWWVSLEAVVVAAIAAAQAGLNISQQLLRGQLGHRVNMMILEKALTLRLADFEDSTLYDKLTRARREASVRPLSLVQRTFSLIQNLVSLVSFSILLWHFSPWAVLILVVAGLPAFLAETKFSNDAFRLFRWRSPETRKRMYLETVIAREDYVKEVKLFNLGELFLKRYHQIFEKLFAEDRSLTMRRGLWGLLFTLLGTLTFYGAYFWVVFATLAGRLTLGQMTMYLMVFRQGQSAVSASLTAISGMYEDNLYLSNLYEYLEQPVKQFSGERTEGETPGSGIAFENVCFTYPGADTPALSHISFEIKPGTSLAVVGENGSGKTTLIKLLTRLYEPDSGRILLDGTDLREWDVDALQQRMSVIFQDFVRYQLLLGENIGAGDVSFFEDEEKWRTAAEKGMAKELVEAMPDAYQTQLGRWFRDGRELSGGQWQKIALSRAFMRQAAQVLILDEPTAAMDAEAEAQIYEHFRTLAQDRMVILISHRFSTVRMADQIIVLHKGELEEIGDHQTLLANGKRYSRLFNIQAQAYQ